MFANRSVRGASSFNHPTPFQFIKTATLACSPILASFSRKYG